MKKNAILVIMLSLFTLSAFTQNLTLQFEKPTLNLTDEGYTEIIYENCINMGEEGTPELPYLGVDIMLPQGTEVSYIHLVEATWYPVETGIKIKPASKPVPLSKYDGIYRFPDLSEEIYDSENPYPGKITDNLTTHYLCGHSIATYTVCPVSYIPAKEEVKFLKEITIEIGPLPTSRSQEATKFLKTSPLIGKRLNTIVENPEMMANYSYPVIRDENPYDILLISSNDFLPFFDDFVEFKISTGYYVKTISVEEIYAQYTGQDNQEMIRNCIIDYYTNNGISYVILGGDADPNSTTDNIIPHRGFIASDDNDIPADMYYSNLDGTWNDDGDNLWGEPNESDLYSEVSIGRICVDNPTEIENFTNKLILYQDAPVVADIENALILGEELNSTTFGGTYKDQIVEGSSANGYTTVGFPDNSNIIKLYDMLGGWNKQDIFEQFNLIGTNLINHLGHSNVTYNMKMYNSDLTTANFTNDGISRGFSIGYSQGCYNGSFDNRTTSYGNYTSDCFAELITNLETAQVASVANSRYGWYHPGGTNSSSQYYDRLFFDAIFGKDITKIGDMNAESKEDDISYIENSQNWRWVAYELNVFGDPSMDLWTEAPTDIVADYPQTVSVGTSSITFETDAAYARIAVMQDGELIGRAVADENGDVTVEFASITNPAPLDISITAHNKNRHSGMIIIVSDQPYIIFHSTMINDNMGNGNGLIDYGETIYLSLGITNVGDQPAYNTNAFLSTSDPYVTITQNTYNYGIIEAGETKIGPGAFTFEVALNIPDQHQIEFNVEVIADETWNLNFDLEAFAPVLQIGRIIVDDTVGGNSNGHLDAGEEVTVLIPVSNAGHSECFDAMGELSSGSEFITIYDPAVEIGNMPADTTFILTFDVDVDDFTPLGAYADLSMEVTSGELSSDKTYNLTVGLIFEDWESGSFGGKFFWTSSTSIPWGISMYGAYEGDYAVCSGNIGNEQVSNLKVTYNCIADDSISFYKRVSSEEEADWLQFFIDDILQDEWSGFLDWERVCYPVSAGSHSFKWVYTKDYDESKGDDCAWVDFIVFPPTIVTTCYPGPDTSICVELDYQCQALASNYNSLLWETSGTGAFSETYILNPIYYPSQSDYNNGSVDLTLTAASSYPCGDIKRHFTLSFDPLPGIPVQPTGPDYVDLYVTTVSDYIIPAAPYATMYQWQLLPEDAGTISGADHVGTVQWNLSYLGEAFVSVKSINVCGESEYSEEIAVMVDNTVGINDREKGISLNIIPNPSKGVFKLEVTTDKETVFSMDILNSTGSVVYSENRVTIKYQLIKELDLNYLEPGVYYIYLSNKNSGIIRKLIFVN